MLAGLMDVDAALPHAIAPSALTGLIGWWDAQALASLTLSGSNVLGWADQSGGGNTLTWLANGKPTYSATGFNSLPAVSTISSPNFSSLQVSVFPMGTGNTLTFWWVGQFNFGTSAGAGGIALSYVYPGGTSDTNDVRSWMTGSHASTPDEQQITRNNTPSIFATCTNDGNHRVIGTIDSGGVQTLYVDGVRTILATVSGNWATGGVFSLGRSAAGTTNFWGGAFGEAGVATGFTDADHVAGMDLYFKNKWGL